MRSALWLILLVHTVAQAAPADAQCDQTLCWQIAPVVCIANQKSDSCQLDFRLSWQHPEPISLCAELEGLSLHCWQQQTSGELSYQAQIEGSAQLLLRSDGHPRLSRELSVLSRQPARKRRLVAPWSVF
ncbi:DUF3019 domain-containing protein [Rheinheimera texasensis]|jgi:hypothetical protein|uniref:DUF3019 domain-containing protein n=1 Tax=Rheinheimera texasensis TaxID=306205 RepID=UPI0004E156AE|nr:DUF3019 domain-containing protein [Rheinheimera texasensis]